MRAPGAGRRVGNLGIKAECAGVGEQTGEFVAAQGVGVEAAVAVVGATVLVAVGGTGARSAAGMGGAEGWV